MARNTAASAGTSAGQGRFLQRPPLAPLRLSTHSTPPPYRPPVPTPKITEVPAEAPVSAPALPATANAAPTITIALDLFESMLITSFTDLLASTAPREICVSRNLVEQAQHVGTACLHTLIVLVDSALDCDTDPELSPRDGALNDAWLGVLERLQQIKDEKSWT